MHAVIVDPSRVVLKLVGCFFEERGDRVTLYVDSDEALERVCEDRSVDVLITSLEVEPLCGLELCWLSRLSAGPSRPLYIALMSTVHDTENVSQALDCGADDLIAKPISRQQLYARLRMVTRLHNAQNHLYRLAQTDHLTGVYNRGAFFERLEAMLQDPRQAPSLSAIMFDIDHFKTVNDAHGHQLGDDVIKAVATEAAKLNCLLGRIGGEEFALAVSGHSTAQALELAEELRRRCAALQFHSGEDEFQITCSLGVARAEEGESVDSLLRRADIALYRAKIAGRNQVKNARPQDHGMPNRLSRSEAR